MNSACLKPSYKCFKKPNIAMTKKILKSSRVFLEIFHLTKSQTDLFVISTFFSRDASTGLRYRVSRKLQTSS